MEIQLSFSNWIFLELMVGNARLEVAAFKTVIKLPSSRLCKVCRLLTLVDLNRAVYGSYLQGECILGRDAGGVDLLFNDTNLDKILQHLLSDERTQSTSFYKVDNKFSDAIFTYSNFQES